jgi:exonuclease SbcD
VRILHTADWHLGCQLEGRPRLPEQAEVLDEICELADAESADMLLLAGDVFDSPNPPAAAEDLFYATLERLGAGGRRAVVVISGNHDSAERISAPHPLARRHGVALLGLPGQTPAAPPPADGRRVAWPAAGPGWLEVSVPGCPHSAVVAALPYPTEARLNEALGDTLDEEELRSAYSDRVARLLAEAAARFRRDTVNLVVSHLFVAGGEESGSERPIQLGGAYTVDPSAFPPSAQYVALGHLHRPQAVGAPVPVRYAGSPLAYSFGEAGQAKCVYLVDLVPGGAPEVRPLPLRRGRPLVRWIAAEGLEEVERWIAAGRDAGAWIDIELHLRGPLPLDALQRLRQRLPGLVSVRPVVEGGGPVPGASSRRTLAVDELFRLFYRQSRGCDPGPGVVDLFRRLTTDVDAGGEAPDAAGVAAR